MKECTINASIKNGHTSIRLDGDDKVATDLLARIIIEICKAEDWCFEDYLAVLKKVMVKTLELEEKNAVSK